jgi:hypothetical protein
MSFTCKVIVTILRHQMSWGMTSHVYCIIDNDTYRVALPSDRMHHWQVGHESPECITLDNTHLHCNYDQCCHQYGCGNPSHPQAPVTIIAMYISFLIWPQVVGSLSCVCLTSGHFFGCLLVSGGVNLSGSLSRGESSSLSLLIFGTRGPWGLTNHYGTHTGCSASSGKPQACPQLHIANEQWHI